jgi:hypothetical protein
MNIDVQDTPDNFNPLIDSLVSCESFVLELWVAKINQ